MSRPHRFDNQPARRIAELRDAAGRRSRILGGNVVSTSSPSEELPLFTPESSRDTETSPLRSPRSPLPDGPPHTWLARQWQRLSRSLSLRRHIKLRQQLLQRRLLQEARDLRHLASRHHSSILKNRRRIRVLEQSLAALIEPERHKSAMGIPPAVSPEFRRGRDPRRITLIAPWYGALAWPDTTEIAASPWWRWLPDHLARNLAQRGYRVEMLTTCVRDPESNWWENELPIGTEYRDGVLVHRFGVNDDGEERYHKLAALVANQKPIHSDQQMELMRCGINSDALVQYARQQLVDTAVVCIGSIHGLSYDLVQALDGQVTLIAGPIIEPAPGWSTSRDTLASAGRLLFWSEDDRQLAIQRYGHELGSRLITAAVLGPARGARRPGTANRAGSTEDRQLWDYIVDRLVLGVTQSCAS